MDFYKRFTGSEEQVSFNQTRIQYSKKVGVETLASKATKE